MFIIVRRTAFYILSKLKLAKQSIIIPELDSTNIVEIVEYLKAFFKQHEYTVNKAEYSKNVGSALLIVKRSQIKTLVLSMMYKRNVNVKQVRKAASAMKDHKCDNAIIVANQSFSENAKRYARQYNIELWPGRVLDKHSLIAYEQHETETMDQTSHNAGDVSPSICATCRVPVGVRIQRYCLARPELFRGKVFCRADQEEVRKNKLFADYVNGSLKNDDEYTPAKRESPSVEIIPELLSSFLDDCINPYEKTIETQGVLSVVQSLIDIMEKHGSVPSVVMDARDDESLSLVSVRDNLVKISLKDHTYSVTRNMIALLKEEYRDYENLIPKAIIVSLAHDLGKIPELRESGLYNTSKHPLISASKLDELFVGMDDVFWRKDAVEVVREHHISTNNLFFHIPLDQFFHLVIGESLVNLRHTLTPPFLV